MDKYKTSELGQSLKRVFRKEATIEDSVSLAKNEIQSVFNSSKDAVLELDTNIGFHGDVAGLCPVCNGNVIRTKYGYACSNYKDGCKFSIPKSICSRTISISNVKMLLATGKTSKIQGFVSKNKKSFDASLRLDEENKVVFDFPNSPTTRTAPTAPKKSAAKASKPIKTIKTNKGE
jgi:DNA topoisomerase-3